MNNIDLLEQEKRLLYIELKTVKASTRKEEIIDRILEIEKQVLKVLWETTIPNSSNVTLCRPLL